MVASTTTVARWASPSPEGDAREAGPDTRRAAFQRRSATQGYVLLGRGCCYAISSICMRVFPIALFLGTWHANCPAFSNNVCKILLVGAGKFMQADNPTLTEKLATAIADGILNGTLEP